MSSDTMGYGRISEHLKPHALDTWLDEEVVIESLTDLYTTLVAYYILTSSREDREQVEKRLWALTNKWLELVSPIEYIPGLIEELSNQVKHRLWEINDLDLVKNVLRETYMVKQGYREVLDNLREDLTKLLKSIGLERRSGVVGTILDRGDPDKLVSLAVLTIVLSTNIY